MSPYDFLSCSSSSISLPAMWSLVPNSILDYVFQQPWPRTIWQIQSFFFLTMMLTNCRFSPAIASILLHCYVLCVADLFHAAPNPHFAIHLISVFLSIHVSAPLTTLELSQSSFSLPYLDLWWATPARRFINSSLAMPIRVYTSISQHQSSVIQEPKYLNLFTC